MLWDILLESKNKGDRTMILSTSNHHKPACSVAGGLVENTLLVYIQRLLVYNSTIIGKSSSKRAT